MTAGTFDEACQAVLDAPGRSHSLYTTLAPLYDRITTSTDGRYERQYERLCETALDARSVLEIGCGTGRLLALCEPDVKAAVGIDLHVELLALAARRVETAELVRADATDCALGRSFDVVCAFGNVTAHFRTSAEVEAFLETAYEHLRAGGMLVVDAVTDPVAVREESVGVYRSASYQLERATDTAPVPDFPGVSLSADYRVTDRETGLQVTTSERMAIRTFGVDELEAFLTAAGFVDVDMNRSVGNEGAIVAVARRPDA